MSQLILIRGCSGSGKSTLAKTYDCFHLEADKFFIVDGEYQWSGDRIKQAHEFIGELAEKIMSTEADLVISNTFTTLKEFAKYIELAEEFCYKIKVIRCTGTYGNTHGVPEETLAKMANRFQDFDGEELR
jgi:predicted kinase